MKEGEEGGRLLSLANANVRSALLVELDGSQCRGALFGGWRVDAVPEEIAASVAAQHTVVRRLALSSGVRMFQH